ncbi:DMT family transporter [Thiomonas sp. FB-Cd]|uniref:DMT family transporter n=1 Tax=Thiomonas sp. FB-Cd TaxID=1158292 RepID=UPI0009DDF644|nr:DMT family transporter [Thiomonas sp. FB-Cd]
MRNPGSLRASINQSGSHHRLAVLAMVGATLLWSIAGVVTRHLHRNNGLDLVFWRSSFTAITVLVWLLCKQGAGSLWSELRGATKLLWLSALFWAVMFTAFMVALSLTTVAQTLVTDSMSPLVAAVLGWLILRHPLPVRTWGAIFLAMLGMGWMVWHNLYAAVNHRQLVGLLVAFAVPLAAASNWVSLRRAGGVVSMQPALMIGAALSAVAVIGFATPFAVDGHDLGWLAFLGVFQLAVPGLLAIWAAQRLAPAETGLLGLLEVIFGTLWAWLGAGERPAVSTLLGGFLILVALVGNEVLGWRQARRQFRKALLCSRDGAGAAFSSERVR